MIIIETNLQNVIMSEAQILVSKFIARKSFVNEGIIVVNVIASALEIFLMKHALPIITFYSRS